jgi:hypothetical protein
MAWQAYFAACKAHFGAFEFECYVYHEKIYKLRFSYTS